MFVRRLTKPDGRELLLYARSSRGPIPGDIPAPAPHGSEGEPRSHLRWHPLRGEWVAYASQRQNRTFLPPAEYDPLAPSSSEDLPTELPEGPYDVAVFENKGVEVGVTLHHPHGQIYAYSSMPPVPARELAQARSCFQGSGRSLVELMIEGEIRDGRRMLYEGPEVVAFVPVCARCSYEVWIAPRAPIATLDRLGPTARADLARSLKTILRKYDLLWQRPLPYLLVVHQGPTDGAEHPYAHLYIELLPPHRSRERLKYLAGTELGAGMFASDTLPEEEAAELRAVPVDFQ